ncbi:MAG: DinB family protein [Janthinobacterium lividum]
MKIIGETEVIASITTLSIVLSRQIEPAFSMLIEAVEICPDGVWAEADGNIPVWQHLLHTAYYLDKWIRKPDEPFRQPTFVAEDAVNFVAPSKPAIARSQLRQYLWEVIARCRLLLESADNTVLFREVQIHGSPHTLMDQTLGQIRHSLYHVGCISTILLRYTGVSLQWVGYDGPISETASHKSVPDAA